MKNLENALSALAITLLICQVEIQAAVEMTKRSPSHFLCFECQLDKLRTRSSNRNGFQFSV
jgi:hypothetical protein